MAETKDEGGWRFEGHASRTNVTTDVLAAALVEVRAAALADAIGKALIELGSDLVSWVVVEEAGQFGGFVQICEVRTAIYAKVGPS